MTWPVFINAAMLGALAAVSIPILIHLLLKTKQRKMRFSTLRFFDFLDEETVRSRKLRHWLLLLLRLLLIILLVLVFARPYLGEKDGALGREKQKQAIFVLDRSLSMNASDREGRRWERAKAAVRKAITDLGKQARIALIGCDTPALFLAEPGPPEAALKALENLQPTQGSAELGDGFLLAARLMENSGDRFSNLVYVVSDLQRASSRKLGQAPVPAAARLELLPFGDAFTPNLAVTAVQLDPTGGQTSVVTVVNFAEEDADPAPVRLMVDDREVETVRVQVLGGSATNVNLRLPKLAPGWHTAEVRLETKDALELDNVRRQAIFVPPPVSVLVVEPRRGVPVYRQESFFAIAALNPGFGLTNATQDAFAVEKVPPEELARRLANQPAKLPYAAVIVPGLKQWPAAAAAALTAYAHAGGGVLLYLGEAVSPNHYNSELAALLPGKLGTVETATELDWRLWEHDRRSPVFAPFRQPNSGNLAIAKFTRRCGLQVDEASHVLARFQDGVPLLATRPVGLGRVLLANTSADTAWTDWPKHKTYVPWLHCTARFLAGRGVEMEIAPTNQWIAGTEASLALGPDFKNVPLRLLRPDGKEVDCATDEQGFLRDLDFSQAGIYSLRTPQGTEARRLAVNLPVAESDLAALTPHEFQTQMVRSETAPAASAAALFLGRDSDRRELWRVLLLAGLLLMFLETFLSNRTVP